MKNFKLYFTSGFLALQTVLGINFMLEKYRFEREIVEQRNSRHAKTEIRVSGCNIDSIDVNCLCDYFPNLTSLVILDTQITKLPAGLERLKKLKKFNFRNSNSSITVDYSNLSRMQNLEQLMLVDMTLTNFPLEIVGLHNLTSLSVNGSSLKDLPPSIGALSSLESLDLSENGLESLPEEILGLNRLVHLILRNNRLARLPAEIGSLTSLQHLDLKSNYLTELPREIGNLGKLEHLNLAVNYFKSIPNQF